MRTNTVKCLWKVIKESEQALHHLEYCLQVSMNYTLFCITLINYVLYNYIGTVIMYCD